MTIDLRLELADFEAYLRQQIATHVREGKPPPSLVQFGFHFDQDGWLTAYFDCRPHADRDGEWTTHLDSQSWLPRRHWFEAANLPDADRLNMVDLDGTLHSDWPSQPDGYDFAFILGEFIKRAVEWFRERGVFDALSPSATFDYCIEELSGMYQWPVSLSVLSDPQIQSGLAQLIRAHRERRRQLECIAKANPETRLIIEQIFRLSREQGDLA